jgi:glycerol-3-phosphate dehydrogenase (NAD(P)+)
MMRRSERPTPESPLSAAAAGVRPLAHLLASQGNVIDWWLYEPELCRQIIETGENTLFLPGIALSGNLKPSNDLVRVISEKQIVLIVVPSHVMRTVTFRMSG